MQKINNAYPLLSLSYKQKWHAIIWLSLFHIMIITASNYLVQFPVSVFGLTTTWGAFTFPFIFLATDLTVRLFGRKLARKIIFFVMLPALIVSYVFSIFFFRGNLLPLAQVEWFQIAILRIVIASFSAYIIGQLLDITVFNYLRKNKAWWVAPLCATVAGGAIDTFSFYAIAFHASDDAFMAANWFSLGFVDYCWKMTISILFFLPVYGIVLNYIQRKLFGK